MVHSDGSKKKTLVDELLNMYPNIQEVGEEQTLRNGDIIKRPGIVHRLDTDTSGVLLVAKTQEGFEHLKKQFQERTIQKTYHTFVYNHFNETQGVVDRPIGKSRKDFRLWSAQRGARGKMREAITEYTVLTTTKEVSFLEVLLHTGRTHQIRVHMKAINHPVVADSLYAPNHTPLLGFKRLALHARSITFKTLKGEEKEVIAPYPEDFEGAIAQINSVC